MDKTEAREDLESKKTGNKAEETAAKDTEKHPGSPEDETGNDVTAGLESDPTEKLQEELDAAKDKYIRLYSEFENFRKRTAREKIELIQSANEQLLKSLLPVADDFERAENSLPDKNHPDLAGFLLIHSKMKKVLDLYGLKPMEIGQGSEFNADFHEAISQVEPPSPELKGKIVDVIEKGYFLNDKVIRYAKVVVGK